MVMYLTRFILQLRCSADQSNIHHQNDLVANVGEVLAGLYEDVSHLFHDENFKIQR